MLFRGVESVVEMQGLYLLAYASLHVFDGNCACGGMAGLDDVEEMGVAGGAGEEGVAGGGEEGGEERG